MEEQPRLFTLQEATDLLPVLRPMLLRMQSDKRDLDNLHAEIESITPAMATNGHASKVKAVELDMARLVNSLNDALTRISAMGVEVKDIDMGLVDFPSLRGDRIVYLCWTVDEPEIAFWHELDAGIAGRQPL